MIIVDFIGDGTNGNCFFKGVKMDWINSQAHKGRLHAYCLEKSFFAKAMAVFL
jgi:hypothetical protein